MLHNSIRYQDIIVGAGVPLNKEQREQLDLYATLLLEWNQRVNLISRKDESHVWPAHLLHSLSMLIGIAIPSGTRVADLGSGGGLPGVPVAIALPGVTVVLIESIRKKCQALEDIVRRLRLPNTSVLHARAEDVAGMPGHKCSFDLILARAVAPLSDLIRWSLPLVRREQRLSIEVCGKVKESLPMPALLALKGGPMNDEIRDAKKAPTVAYLRSAPISFEGIGETGLVDKSLLIIGL